MLKILRFFSRNKILAAILSIIIGALLGLKLNAVNIMSPSSIFIWICGVGVVMILWSHGKSFFSNGDLGEMYPRIYGFGFGLICTSLVFLLCSFSFGKTNSVFNILSYMAIFSISIYNFLSNKYLGVEKEHTIAEILLKKEADKNKKDDNK